MNIKKKTCFVFAFSILLLGIITPMLNPSALIRDTITDNHNRLDSTILNIGEAVLANNIEEKSLIGIDAESDSFIEVNVYDSMSTDPIDLVNIDILDEGLALIESVITTGGFYNFTDLVIGEYTLEFSVTDYYPASEFVMIEFVGQPIYLDVNLDPIPPRSITILTPTASQTVAGGSVLVSFTTSDVDLMIVNISVNAEFIATTYYNGINELFVPVFLNGTNVIELYADWGDGSHATDTVSINSVDVIPIFPIKQDDFYHQTAESFTLSSFMVSNYTFNEWLSPFVINVTAIYHLYDIGGTIDMLEDWMTVNVLNGYIATSGGAMMGWETTRFMGFSCLACPESTGTLPIIGDKTIYGIWNDIFTITGSVIWNNIDVWVLSNAIGCTMYVEKSTQLIVYLLYPGMARVELMYTSIDCTNPIVTTPTDVEYGFGDTGNSITWSATDLNPLTYTLYVDDVENVTDVWHYAIGIEFNVDNHAAGIYEYKIIFFDAGGNSVEDIVLVTVAPLVPELNQTYYPLILSFLILLTYTSVVYRKQKLIKK
ncbi:MAG: carboxypeptidase-like regulatory domain-containing protein [Candidatus Heimdallarchaeaceae archaeon]